jgi:hypothetical protein
VFAGYASHLLAPETLVQAVSDVLDESPYNELLSVLDMAECRRVLEAAAEPVDVGRLEHGADAGGSRTWFSVQWLLKYGFLRVVQPARRETP